MRERLPSMRDRPAATVAGVDPLSDAVAALRGGRAHAARTRHAGPSRQRLPGASGTGFHVVLHGSCRLSTPGGAPVALAAGDVALLPRGTAHTVCGDAGLDLLCGAYLRADPRVHPALAPLPDLLVTRADERMRAAVDLLGEEGSAPEHRRPGAGAMVPALLDVLLLHVLRGWFDGADAPPAPRDPAVAAAVRMIHAEPAHAWSVAELGARCGLSRAAFARRFTAAVGQPPLAYLTWWRMTVATRLLRETELPLSVVARRVGYASEFAFGHAFRRERGHAPGAFRRNGSSG
jgi:AraC-like DNA-binding protein